MGAHQFIRNTSSLTNLTLPQFAEWNPDANLQSLRKGEVVCIGYVFALVGMSKILTLHRAPGDVYTPYALTASPTIFTTTAHPALPTPNGTIHNCGLYHEVVSGDYCNLISLNYSITFSDLIDMNPSLDSSCSNLMRGLKPLLQSLCIPRLTQTRVRLLRSTGKWYQRPAPDDDSSTKICHSVFKWWQFKLFIDKRNDRTNS